MTITKRLGDWILRLMFGPDPEPVAAEVPTRKFHKANGTPLLSGVSHVEIRVDDSGFRLVRNDGTVTPWSDNGHFTIALAERCLESGYWLELP